MHSSTSFESNASSPPPLSRPSTPDPQPLSPPLSPSLCSSSSSFTSIESIDVPASLSRILSSLYNSSVSPSFVTRFRDIIQQIDREEEDDSVGQTNAQRNMNERGEGRIAGNTGQKYRDPEKGQEGEEGRIQSILLNLSRESISYSLSSLSCCTSSSSTPHSSPTYHYEDQHYTEQTTTTTPTLTLVSESSLPSLSAHKPICTPPPTGPSLTHPPLHPPSPSACQSPSPSFLSASPSPSPISLDESTSLRDDPIKHLESLGLI